MADFSYVANPNFFLLLTNFLYVQTWENQQEIQCLSKIA